MKVEIQELEPCKRQIVVEAPAEDVAREWEAACGRVQREARLPGFRPGKVPRALVRSRFADEVRRTVAEALVPATYRRALSEARLEPVDEPEVRDLQLQEGQPLRFTAIVEIKPHIDLAGYRGVLVRHTPRVVTDADVETTLRGMAERHATLGAVTRPARAGDHVIVDYELAPEGAEPRRQTGYAFRVGAGVVLPEMDEAVIGLGVGDERRVNVRLAENHPREALRGWTGRLWLRVVEVKEPEVPMIDDDFARGLGSYQSLGELRQAVREGLEREQARQDRRALDEAVLDAVLAAHAFAVPEGLVLREIAHRVGHARDEMARQGLDPDAVPWDYAKLREQLRPAAARAVRRGLLLEAIAEREELTVTDAEVEAEVARLAQAAGRAPQAMRGLLQRQGDLETLRHGLREAKTLALLVAEAQIQPQAS
jgi:trigger factor